LPPRTCTSKNKSSKRTRSPAHRVYNPSVANRVLRWNRCERKGEGGDAAETGIRRDSRRRAAGVGVDNVRERARIDPAVKRAFGQHCYGPDLLWLTWRRSLKRRARCIGRKRARVLVRAMRMRGRKVGGIARRVSCFLSASAVVSFIVISGGRAPGRGVEPGIGTAPLASDVHHVRELVDAGPTSAHREGCQVCSRRRRRGGIAQS
jgi:hypothetical protein